ncbi:hypothetical protein [Gynuella sunshinyii]|uniref:Lipoprotein n=1 Tax=Gynuella sunshinyii YC6258 TaxID=1445510 RepID=A0A0C5VR80_9GAMM|nr:hypothetical protein [Gynuella sunshinyii]AJQ95918.1 hypothetical Protein YC6258_03882 [Gynuella sunshinyii YC6258]
MIRQWFLLIGLLLTSCSNTRDGLKTAEEFWNAVSQKDYQQAAAYTLESDPIFIQSTLFFYRNYEPELGKPQKLKDRIIIPTLLKNTDNDKTLKLFTIVTPFDDGYRIAYKTMVKAFVGDLKNKLDQHLDDGEDWLDQQLEDFEQWLEPWLEYQDPDKIEQFSI